MKSTCFDIGMINFDHQKIDEYRDEIIFQAVVTITSPGFSYGDYQQPDMDLFEIGVMVLGDCSRGTYMDEHLINHFNALIEEDTQIEVESDDEYLHETVDDLVAEIDNILGSTLPRSITITHGYNDCGDYLVSLLLTREEIEQIQAGELFLMEGDQE